MLDSIKKLHLVLKSLGKLTFIDGNDNEINTIEGYKIQLRNNFAMLPRKKATGIQWILTVSKDDTYNVFTWGCMGEKDTDLLLNWFYETSQTARQRGYEIKDIAREKALQEFENLINA